MQKLALLLAAGMLVSAPLAMATLSYAAAKKKEPTPQELNMRFANAVGDLGKSLATYTYVYKPAKK